MVLFKTPAEIKIMRQGGAIAAAVMQSLIARAEMGATLLELDELARKLIKKGGARPAFLGYRPAAASRPYPAAICASLNNVIVHGLPTDYKLQDGDLLKIDFGVLYQDYYTDLAVTVGVGRVSSPAKKLMAATRGALKNAINVCRSGKRLGDIGWAIAHYVEARGFNAVHNLIGHGIGRSLHEDPEVFNYGERGQGLELSPGMVLAIEPMISAGSPYIIQLPDESYATADGSLSAHFEQTVAITEAGPRILTAPG